MAPASRRVQLHDCSGGRRRFPAVDPTPSPLGALRHRRRRRLTSTMPWGSHTGGTACCAGLCSPHTITSNRREEAMAAGRRGSGSPLGTLQRRSPLAGWPVCCSRRSVQASFSRSNQAGRTQGAVNALRSMQSCMAQSGQAGRLHAGHHHPSGRWPAEMGMPPWRASRRSWQRRTQQMRYGRANSSGRRSKAQQRTAVAQWPSGRQDGPPPWGQAGPGCHAMLLLLPDAHSCGFSWKHTPLKRSA